MRMKTAALVVAACLAGTAGMSAQQSGAGTVSTYQVPPKAVVDIVDAAPLPLVQVSPARDVLALTARRSMPTIAELSQPMLRLAGIRVNPQNNGPHRAPSGTGITLRTIATGAERQVQVPPGARIGALSFSPDGRRFSFTNTRETRIDLHVGDVATGQVRLVEGRSTASGAGATGSMTARRCCARSSPPDAGRRPPRRRRRPAPTSRRTSGSPVPCARTRTS